MSPEPRDHPLPPQLTPRALSLLVERIDNPLCLLDGHGRIIFANAALADALGCPPSAAVGERLIDVMPALGEGFTADLQGVLASSTAGAGVDPAGRHDTADYRLVACDEEDAGTRLAVCVLPTPTGAPTIEPAIVTAGGDDDSLAGRLRRANEDIQAFAYIASHDLQEPLRTIATCATVLGRRAEDRLDAKDREFLHYAIDGATRMERMLQDLLQFSRACIGDLASAPVALADAVWLAIKDLAAPIAATGARITVGELPTVPGNAAMLTRVFHNLLDNALKFRGEDAPRIAIEARRQGVVWEISVADNGLGIAPEFHDRVFGIFKRLHGRSRYPGNGAGLAIARRIVERHGGAIRVESPSAGGTIMHLTLPAQPEHRAVVTLGDHP